ncbi:unnamed protein product [Meganyctiphanes norvegica]|uniref:Transglutaminase-like domain-containing protein n=1 Tax=Meganyctiphanes norvegica TaxID=48144 RepID=A0AAV2PNC2_MEGNR
MEDDGYNGYMEPGSKRQKTDDKPDTINPIGYVDWCIKDNARKHRTIKYDLVHDKQSPTPVLRRGQSFKIIVNYTDRDFSREWDRVSLSLKFGNRPSRRKGTLIQLHVVNDNFTQDHDEWDAMIDQETALDKLVIQVRAPSDVPVGLWRLQVRSELSDTREFHESEETESYIIFNPWCKDDTVYMSAEDKLDEYILNDDGKVFAGGSAKYPVADPWAYGQFDDDVLPIAVHILDFARFSSTGRGSAVQVVRAISAGVNHQDDDGILVGNWTDDFSKGVEPWVWTGSVRILEEYRNSGYQPVKYGQCWVFSALTVTICRALGIPCRSVTNYESAHDTNNSLTIDNFFDADGNHIAGGPDGDNKDSIWNFHVWNDVWMTRPDLPPGYGGWQAIDSTPQEESANKMQCGPASLVAIRRGDIGFNYDVPFVFSEVNADVMFWQEDDTSDWGFSRMHMAKSEVGVCVWTKLPEKDDELGDDDNEDITLQYKNKEGTAAERLAIHNAIRGCKLAKQYYECKTSRRKDVGFELQDLEKINIGDPFKVQVVMTNKSSDVRTVTAALTAHSTYYTGILHKKIKKTDEKLTLAPGEQKTVTLNVNYNEYWKQLVPGCLIKMYVICRVSETGQTYTDEDNFSIEKPKLQIQMSENAQAHEPCQATIVFKNPLDVPLTKCRLSVEGAGLLKSMAIAVEGDVAPNGQFEYTVEFNPRVHGRRKLIACFNSLELFNVNGVKSINIKK